MLHQPDGFRPCTPAGVHALLCRSNVPLEGAEVVILGRGNIVGKPMAAMLLQKSPQANATVTLCHSRSQGVGEHCRRADIIIAAMGVPHFLKKDMVKPGAVIIDVGVNRIADPGSRTGSRLVGDVDFDAVQPIAGMITPNPGGVGWPEPRTYWVISEETLKDHFMGKVTTASNKSQVYKQAVDALIGAGHMVINDGHVWFTDNEGKCKNV